MQRLLIPALLLLAALGCSESESIDMPSPPSAAEPIADTGPGSDGRNDDGEVITMPRSGAKITSNPIHIEGTARTFENNVSIRVVGDNGREILSTFTTASGEMGNYNPFATDLWLTRDPGRNFTIQSVEYSARDGSPRLLDSISVENRIEPIEVELFFPKNAPQDCTRVEPLKRVIPKSEAMGELIIRALMRGPTPEEASVGLTNPFPSGARLGSVAMNGNILVADFSSGMGNVGGSCRAQSIRASLEKTLKALPTVSNVRILASGDEATALQP